MAQLPLAVHKETMTKQNNAQHVFPRIPLEHHHINLTQPMVPIVTTFPCLLKPFWLCNQICHLKIQRNCIPSNAHTEHYTNPSQHQDMFLATADCFDLQLQIERPAYEFIPVKVMLNHPNLPFTYKYIINAHGIILTSPLSSLYMSRAVLLNVSFLAKLPRLKSCYRALEGCWALSSRPELQCPPRRLHKTEMPRENLCPKDPVIIGTSEVEWRCSEMLWD